MNSSFKIAVRIFKKNILTKLLSVITLSIGFLFFLIAVTVYVKDFNFNNKFEHSSRIYKIDTRIQFNSGDIQEMSVSPAGVGPFIKENFSDAQNQTRVWSQPALNLKVIDKEYFGEDVVKVDMSFFELFTFEIVKGSLGDNVTSREDIAVLSEQEAIKFFGDLDPLGKALVIGEVVYEVVAVVKPSKTDFDHAVYLSIDPDLYKFEWTETFILINGEKSINQLTINLNSELKKLMEGEYNEDVMKISFVPTSLTEMRFQDKLFGTVKSNQSFLNFIMTMALSLMALCCFSVLNLESTISLRRTKEIQLKNIFGASKLTQFFQFIIENIIVFLISIPIAVLTFMLILPVINYSWSYNIELIDITDPLNIFLILILTSIFIALTAFINYVLHFGQAANQGQNLKNPIFIGMKRFILPFQIFMCTAVILFSSLSAHQIHHSNEVDVNFNYHDIFVVDVIGETEDSEAIEFIKIALKSQASIVNVAKINKNSVPGRESDVQLFNLNSSESDKEIVAQHLFIDEDYFSVLGIKNDLIRDIKGGGLVVNQKMSKGNGIVPLEKNTLNHTPVLGITSNYFHDGVFGDIKPTVYEYDETKFNSLLIKTIEGQNLQALQSKIDALIKHSNLVAKASVFSLKDVYFARQSSDLKLLEIITFCNYFVILIALLGIFSSSNMLLNLTNKENTLRRILGALKKDILKSTAKNIYIESLIGLILAITVTHWIFFNWQEKYSLKAPLQFANYLPLLGIILGSAGAFVCLFFIKINEIKTSDLTTGH